MQWHKWLVLVGLADGFAHVDERAETLRQFAFSPCYQLILFSLLSIAYRLLFFHGFPPGELLLIYPSLRDVARIVLPLHFLHLCHIDSAIRIFVMLNAMWLAAK